MWRDSCRINNPSCCEIPRCEVHYDTDEGICYLCKKRHKYLRQKRFEEEQPDDGEDYEDDNDEDGEIRNEEMKDGVEFEEDGGESRSRGEEELKKDAQKDGGDSKSKRRQLAEVESAIEVARMINEEYVFPFFGLRLRSPEYADVLST
jgi:hypothetical protein